MAKYLLHLIRLYQKTAFFSKPVFKTLFLSDAICRFSPTCSQYSYEAIQRFGSIKGVYLSLKRIVRCHPWARGGYDPIPKP